MVDFSKELAGCASKEDALERLAQDLESEGQPFDWAPQFLRDLAKEYTELKEELQALKEQL